MQTMEDAPTGTECKRYTDIEYEVRADEKGACASHEMRSVEARRETRGRGGCPRIFRENLSPSDLEGRGGGRKT